MPRDIWTIVTFWHEDSWHILKRKKKVFTCQAFQWRIFLRHSLLSVNRKRLSKCTLCPFYSPSFLARQRQLLLVHVTSIVVANKKVNARGYRYPYRWQRSDAARLCECRR